MTENIPVIGNWYKRPGGSLFEVVAVDEDDRTIEVQHYDGTLGEYDLETWNEMLLIDVSPPEDWSGSFDIDREDCRDGRGDDDRGSALNELLDS